MNKLDNWVIIISNICNFNLNLKRKIYPDIEDIVTNIYLSNKSYISEISSVNYKFQSLMFYDWCLRKRTCYYDDHIWDFLTSSYVDKSMKKYFYQFDLELSKYHKDLDLNTFHFLIILKLQVIIIDTIFKVIFETSFYS